MIDRNINVFFDVILLKKENLKSVFWGVQLSIPVSQMFYTRRVTHNKQIATSKDMMKDCQLQKL